MKIAIVMLKNEKGLAPARVTFWSYGRDWPGKKPGSRTTDWICIRRLSLVDDTVGGLQHLEKGQVAQARGRENDRKQFR